VTATSADTSQSRPSRRRKVPLHRRCDREGCKRRKAIGHEYCSFLCRLITVQMTQAERICELVGPGTHTGELWAAVVEMSDAWSKVQSLQTHLRNCALSVGITAEQWSALMDVEKGTGQPR
jgi:hypothetical protein